MYSHLAKQCILYNVYVRCPEADSLTIGKKVAEKSPFWKAGFSPKFLNNGWKGAFSPNGGNNCSCAIESEADWACASRLLRKGRSVDISEYKEFKNGPNVSYGPKRWLFSLHQSHRICSQDRNTKRLCICWKGAFSAEKSPFCPIATSWAVLEHFVLWNVHWANLFIEIYCTCSVCFRWQCTWAVVLQVGEKVPFQPLFTNIGEKPAFRKGDFLATFSPISKELASGKSVSLNIICTLTSKTYLFLIHTCKKLSLLPP